MLVGCVQQKYYISIENFYGEESKYNTDDVLKEYSWLKSKQSVYQTSTNNLTNLEIAKSQALRQCKIEWSNLTLLGFTNLEGGCVDYTSPGGAFSKEQTEKRKQFRIALKQEKQKKIIAFNKYQEDAKKNKISDLESKYADQCKKFKKGTSEFVNCLFAAEKEVINKQKELDNKLAKMTPVERREYNCENAFKFRKGSDKFRDCVFKLYTTELELEKLELQKQVALANERAAKAQAEAAQSAQARAEAVAAAQIAAAEAQKSAARSQSLASSLSLMQLGSSMMSSPAPAPSSPGMDRMRTTCRNVGGFINCY
jgi:hypothetical protein